MRRARRLLESKMLTDKLEKRYAKIRRKLARRMAQIKTFTPAEEKQWNRLEAELCEVGRRFLMQGLAFAD